MLRTVGKRVLRAWPPLFERTAAYVKARDIRRGLWVEPELALVALTLGPGDTAIDVGANYGLWSYHLARAVRPTGRVIAFEPISSTVRILSDVLQRLGVAETVSVNACGVSDRNDQVTFTVPLAGKLALPVRGLAHITPPGQDEDPLAVEGQVVRLDDWPIGGHVSLLKIDVEGGELAALRGAVGLLTEHRPMVICETGLEGRYGHSTGDVVAFMATLGYHPYQYREGILEPFDRAGPAADLNLVFSPLSSMGP